MIVLGIDPGTAVTGYGVVKGDRSLPPRLIECGVIRTRARDTLPQRLREIHAGVVELIERHHPDAMSIEDVFYARNVRTTIVLGHARGVILLAGEQSRIEIFEYPPAEIKKSIVGTGGATKLQVQFMVMRLLRLKTAPEPSDAADGVAAALSHVMAARLPKISDELGAAYRAQMIARVAGKLILKDIDRVEVMTDGGVGYELQIPLGVFETLPKQGEHVSLHTWLVVKEDSWQLFGFSSLYERRLFQKLLTANGVGPALAIGMLSSLSADRLVRAIQDKDIAVLQGVPRVGRKKAERLILDLADKLDGLGGDEEPGTRRPAAGASEDALRALVSLGYSMSDAEKGVRAALDDGGGGLPAAELIRSALAKLADK